MKVHIKPFRTIIKPQKVNDRVDEGIIDMFEVDEDPKPGDFKICLAAPVPYYTGAGMMGLQIVSNIIDKQGGMFSDYTYLPPPEVRRYMKKFKIPAFGYRSKLILRNFDIIGFTMFFAPNVANMIQMLKMAYIPFLAKDRDERFPLIIGGGIMFATPEPLAPFFDVCFIGEAEEQLPMILQIIKDMKLAGKTKFETLRELALKISGCYVPQFYEPKYDPQNKRFIGLQKKLPEVPDKIYWQKVDISNPKYNYTIANFDASVRRKRLYLTKDIEVSRGCSGSCRFCSPGYLYRPYRERNFEGIKEAILGRKDLGTVRFMGLTPTDYAHYNEAVQFAVDNGLQYDAYSERIDKYIDTRNTERIKRNVCFAIETANERLRASLNKHISDKQWEKAVRQSLQDEVRHNKLMVMCGLPNETEQDVFDFFRLFEKMMELRREIRPKSHIEISINPFTAKAHTPFQWEAHGEPSYVKKFTDEWHRKFESGHFGREVVESGKLVVKGWMNMKSSPNSRDMESLMEMGDRRIAPCLIKAVIHFNIFSDEDWGETDGNLIKTVREYMKLDYGYDINDFFRQKKINETLPWDHIQSGVSKEFLWQEKDAAQNFRLTPTCFQECLKCGITTNLKKMTMNSSEMIKNCVCCQKGSWKRKENSFDSLTFED